MSLIGYTKLFASIVTSSLWCEDDKTRIVFVTMLALSDQDGFVSASLPGLAKVASVDLDACARALDKLTSPDPHSRTRENEGRRVQAVDGGWVVLNHAKYRAKMNLDDRREYLRQKQREHRARQHGVNKRQQMSTLSTHTEAYSESSTAEEKKDPSSKSHKRLLTDGWCERWKAVHGQPYQFRGAADGRAADSLLKLGLPLEDLLAIAEKAWRLPDGQAFERSHAVQLTSFASQFNRIRLAVGLKAKASTVADNCGGWGDPTPIGDRK